MSNSTDKPSRAAQLLRHLMPDSVRNLLAEESEHDMTTSTRALPLELVAELPIVDAESVVVDAVADVGNARTFALVAPIDGAKPIEVTMPSVRSLRGAFSYRLFAERGKPAGSWHALADDEHVLELGGVERFLGQLAAEHAPAASTGRGSDERYSDGTVLDFVLVALARALPRARKISARLATVVPISLWETIALSVEQSLKGRHSFRYNGRDVEVHISEVVVMREGEAAYLALSKRHGGRELLLDGGGRTHNAALFAEGVYRTGVTIEIGLDTTLDDVDSALIGKGLRALTLAERLELLDAMNAKDPREYSIVVHGQRHRVDDVARKYFDTTARALVQELHSRIKVDRAEHITYFGGAAYPTFFGRAVVELLKRATIAPELEQRPEAMNAYGALAKLTGIPRKVRKGK